MLVLSRRANEAIFFPSLGITLRVVRVRGSIVRLGIEAPPEVKVVRGELIDSSAPVVEVVGLPWG